MSDTLFTTNPTWMNPNAYAERLVTKCLGHKTALKNCSYSKYLSYNNLHLPKYILHPEPHMYFCGYLIITSDKWNYEL